MIGNWAGTALVGYSVPVTQHSLLTGSLSALTLLQAFWQATGSKLVVLGQHNPGIVGWQFDILAFYSFFPSGATFTIVTMSLL